MPKNKTAARIEQVDSSFVSDTGLPVQAYEINVRMPDGSSVNLSILTRSDLGTWGTVFFHNPDATIRESVDF
jgi:hypothetical protein